MNWRPCLQARSSDDEMSRGREGRGESAADSLPKVTLLAASPIAVLYADTSALVALVPWRWWPFVLDLEARCGVRLHAAPEVRAEYHEVWARKLSFSLGADGAKERPDQLGRVAMPPAPTPSEVIAIAAVSEAACATLGVTKCGEAEAISYALLRGGHVLVNDPDVEVIHQALLRMLREVGRLPTLLRDPISSWPTKLKQSIWSTSAAPLILATEGGLCDFEEIRKEARRQTDSGETPPHELRRYVGHVAEPRKRRVELRRLAIWWHGFFREGFPGTGSAESSAPEAAPP
jgi:hypothetical protein